jgi:hypothetical protein
MAKQTRLYMSRRQSIPEDWLHALAGKPSSGTRAPRHWLPSRRIGIPLQPPPAAIRLSMPQSSLIRRPAPMDLVGENIHHRHPRKFL